MDGLVFPFNLDPRFPLSFLIFFQFGFVGLLLHCFPGYTHSFLRIGRRWMSATACKKAYY